MEIRVLRYFLAVAREQSITGAAENLHVTQPTLSKQLMDLENELGKKLFIRGNRNITLTDDGIYLRKKAQEIIDLVDKTTANFNTPDEIIGGTISIGAGETKTMTFLAKVMSKLQSKYPDIHYNLYSGNIENVTERLEKGLLDFGLILNPNNMPNLKMLKLPDSEKLCLIMRKDSPLAKLKSIEPNDLLNIPLIIPSSTSNNLYFLKWLGFDLDKLNIVATFNLIYNASLLVEQGVGYALCIDSIINPDSNENLCIRPLKNSPELPSFLVWKKYQVFSKPAQKFLDEFQKELKNINQKV